MGNVGWQKILERFAEDSGASCTAGPHTIIVGFIDRSHVESDDNVGGGGGFGGGGGAPMARLPNAQNVALEIKGPYNPTGISYSTSRPLIFICDPKKTGEAALRQTDRGEPGAPRLPPACHARTTSPS